MRTTWVRTDKIQATHEVLSQLLMHDVSIGRLKRRLADSETEILAVLANVTEHVRNLSRRVEQLEARNT